MESMLQNLIVALLVPACVGYALWKVMPAVARRSLASAALRWPVWPAAWRERLGSAARRSAGGCGCDGCDHRIGARAATPAAQPIVLHRRPAGTPRKAGESHLA